MVDQEKVPKQVEDRVKNWENVLSKTGIDETLWRSLENWWRDLVMNHEGIEDDVRRMHLSSFSELKNMDVRKVRQMLNEYEMGSYPDSENLRRESVIHLFLAIIENHHKLW